ncbi:MAG TPA: exopolysaccharide biosynthesis polyprenyl glycosylphosphotransferase [Candidatus Polarisedimenticolia bacterium]|jgi:exopolysaccharide biosynthesis polyprenyl glycosylphosphotransferase|nr:exopolysaccharide biosynthesis polyprenyl glycosylphosphotransferase [Candidatus Polarisedimenticolia bacterium]
MHSLWAVIESNLALSTVFAVMGMGLFALLTLRTRRSAAGTEVRDPGSGERVLILGSGPLARELIHEMGSRGSRWTIVGVIPEVRSLGPAPPYPVMGSLEDLDVIVGKVRPHRIVVALDERRGRLPVGPLLESRVRGVAVEEGVEFYERLTRRLAIDALTPSALIFSGGFQRRRVAAFVGRGMSLFLSAVAVAVTAPLWPLIALAIRLDSRGPAVFTQERVGRGGRKFGLLKFRTMHAEGANGSSWVRDNSDRITRAGRFLRWSHLDELPQFINVLRGDMNLVGPRPHPVSNFELFSDRIPYYALRAAIRPGVTGWAQVRYRYANTLQEESEKMRYDLYYIKHRSLWLDLRILARTARVLLLGLGPERKVAEATSVPPHTSGARAA